MELLAHDLVSWLLPYLLPAARVVGIVAFLPVFSAAQVPVQVRLLIAAGVSVLTVAGMETPLPAPATADAFLLAALAELALGIVVGWAVAVLFAGIQWAGEILDIQTGLRVAEMFDPVSVHGTSLLGQLYHLMAVTFFLVIDGHHWVLASVAKSLERLGPGEIAFGASALKVLLSAATSALDIGIRVAGAGLAALVLADVALAIVGRHVPQMNVFLVGIPAKLGAGILVMAGSVLLLSKTLGGLVPLVRVILGLLLVGR